MDLVFFFFKCDSALVWEMGGLKDAVLRQLGPSFGEQVTRTATERRGRLTGKSGRCGLLQCPR